MSQAYKQHCIHNSAETLSVMKSEIYDYKSRFIFT